MALKNKPSNRVPLHRQKVAQAPQREGFKRRFVNETVGRIEAFLKAGWKIVEGDIETADPAAQDASQMGSVVRRVVNKKAGLTPSAVLMEIPEELFLEDQADKQKENDFIERSYDPNGLTKKDAPSDGAYGKIERRFE